MKIEDDLIRKLRNEKSWSQEELATASGLNIRTVQRVEKNSSASLQTKRSLALALGIEIQELDFEDDLMKICPTCKSGEIYQYRDYFQYSGVGEELLPKASKGIFSVAKICPFVCIECGHVRIMASSEARENIASSEHWVKI